jgi:hypothetical protein
MRIMRFVADRSSRFGGIVTKVDGFLQRLLQQRPDARVVGNDEWTADSDPE